MLPTAFANSIWHYEIGEKITSASGRVRANVSGFYIDWKNMQQAVLLATLNPGCASVITSNAGASTVKGIDMDLTVVPFEDVPFTLHATVGYARARLDNPGGGQGVAGARIPTTPDWTGSLSGEYEFDIFSEYSGLFRLGATYTGSQVNLIVDQDSEFNQIPSNLIINSNLTFYSGDGWQASLFANNLLDEEIIYGSGVLFGESFTRQTAAGRPWTVGVRFNKDF